MSPPDKDGAPLNPGARRDHALGRLVWFRRKRVPGSYFAFSRANRAWVSAPMVHAAVPAYSSRPRSQLTLSILLKNQRDTLGRVDGIPAMRIGRIPDGHLA
jgi:hypothetical protein